MTTHSPGGEIVLLEPVEDTVIICNHRAAQLLVPGIEAGRELGINALVCHLLPAPIWLNPQAREQGCLSDTVHLAMHYCL